MVSRIQLPWLALLSDWATTAPAVIARASRAAKRNTGESGVKLTVSSFRLKDGRGAKTVRSTSPIAAPATSSSLSARSRRRMWPSASPIRRVVACTAASASAPRSSLPASFSASRVTASAASEWSGGRLGVAFDRRSRLKNWRSSEAARKVTAMRVISVAAASAARSDASSTWAAISASSVSSRMPIVAAWRMRSFEAVGRSSSSARAACI